ncbi:unnamed protein product [Lactuca virosa]|uniref:HAT C-terminal dimerisation domain-containing protein n=1 Tax=Lactuca virosa TaxID=75947 RepID=A0AAU9NGU1_9ASTR|nr:unnamed protein product [Lactuca virosa]
MPRTTKINILEYWRRHRVRYPDLTTMARDILIILVSIVASESAFSVGGKVLDQHRSSLKSDVTEEIICTKYWLFGEANYNVGDVVNEVVILDINEEPNPVKSSTSCMVNTVNS